MKLQEKYFKEVVPILKKEYGIKNPLAVPKVKKIIINVGLGEALTNKKIMEIMSQQLSLISGQKPITTQARRAISGFKIRKGHQIGLKVILRKKKMYDFLEKLVAIVFPRVRDFRGVDAGSFDNSGNFTLGFKEITIFPEVDYSKLDKVRGLELTIVTSARNKKEGQRLLELLGIPFRKES